MYLGRMISQLWLNVEQRDVITGANASVHHKRLEVATPAAEKGREMTFVIVIQMWLNRLAKLGWFLKISP